MNNSKLKEKEKVRKEMLSNGQLLNKRLWLIMINKLKTMEIYAMTLMLIPFGSICQRMKWKERIRK